MGGGPHVYLGAVDYPLYMKAWHHSSLNVSGTVWASVSITGAMNECLEGGSPYANYVGVNTEDILLGGKELTDFEIPYNLLSNFILLELSSTITGLRSISQVNNLKINTSNFASNITLTASSLLEQDLNEEKIKGFHISMRDINAVMCSSFIVGESILWGGKLKELTPLDKKMRQYGWNSQIVIDVEAEGIILSTALAGVDLQRFITITTAEFSKLFTVSSVELDINNLEIVAKDMLWDLKIFQYGGNFLGSIKGTAVHVDPGDQTGSKVFTMVSRSSQGAGIGFQIGNAICPGWGSLIGAIVGTVAGVAAGAVENWG